MRNEIRNLRTNRQLSQQRLAEAMDVSRQTINWIEKERYTPSLPLAIALARYFGQARRGDAPMETAMRDKPFWRSRWWLPLFSLALGGAMFAAYAIGGDPGEGSLRLWRDGRARGRVPGGRSETLRGLGEPSRDERWAAIDLRASAFAGTVVITAIIERAFLRRVANGEDASPYAQFTARSAASPTSRASPSCAGDRSYLPRKYAN